MGAAIWLSQSMRITLMCEEAKGMGEYESMSTIENISN